MSTGWIMLAATTYLLFGLPGLIFVSTGVGMFFLVWRLILRWGS